MVFGTLMSEEHQDGWMNMQRKEAFTEPLPPPPAGTLKQLMSFTQECAGKAEK